MIDISRRLSKTVATMIRRTLRLAGRAANEQIVQFCTDREGLRIVAVGVHHALEYRQERSGCRGESLLLPLKALSTIAADSDETAVLSQDRHGVVTVHWKAGVLPQSKTFEPVDPPKAMALSIETVEWTIQPQEFLFALREAFRTTDDASSRYAMTCVQVRGENGDVAATDGRSLFLQGGFSFPFRDNLLLRPTHAFERDNLFGHCPVRVGIFGEYLAIKSGPWLLRLGLNREGRFPRVDAVAPHIDADTPTMELAATDRAFLAENVKRLPNSEGPNQPVTVDLNGNVSIRSKEPQALATELVLSRSQRCGGETRVAIDRRFLERAANLGFSAMHFTGPESPVVCRDGYRTFVWAALDKSQIVPPSADAVVIESEVAVSAPRRRRVAVV